MIEAQLLHYDAWKCYHPSRCFTTSSSVMFVLFFILLPVTQTTLELWVMKFKYMKQQINFNITKMINRLQLTVLLNIITCIQ